MASRIPPFAPVKARIQADIRNRVIPAITETVQHELADFREYVARQTFPAARTVPLSVSWARFKRDHGLDRRTLIATGHYTRSIRLMQRSNKRSHITTWEVGFPHNLRARTPRGRVADITLRELAAVLEFGSTHNLIPARPHWQPFWSAANVRMARNVLRRIGVGGTRRLIP